MTHVTPFKESSDSKKLQVEQMFDQISHRYDFLNHFLSLGIDKLWRKKAVKILRSFNPDTVLDVATGTADFAIAALDSGAKEIVGIDISEGMLNVGREKVKKYNGRIRLERGDSEHIQFNDQTFDAIIVAFGVRNFEHLQKGLNEMRRVLKPGGHLIVLEFSKPSAFPVKQLYNFYFKYILPFWGNLLAKHKTAYSYLPESVMAFPEGEQFVAELKKAGYSSAENRPLSFGISSIYIAQK
ncbi:MAG: bifunctional demethylmenaquinone methyltransferase/2-methoxy-6-polyprenyl-1,4-benzoquinol methylase UbiE [Bacteroidia bacterium]|nr:bifunctional demethylmenaquinone methyltransferase/2-methoxy-6-polyprenyl-1,4-benzoquinol methylase UbiE [Bacteroidia bacterium]MBP7261193.1 bifunctional demethylmenaquinone methyltransferase/2-methoxy-6-polyprenyl-1,4-benzoquinol methylase UbiE [Bacteroidia bacterium]MBP9180591.1 bifunctional demethylmenaquinone methyltransferase/2-methoxy-6-polyprenyl-1,4-benzoquinol methylase UbiE [Bacteroidia bacterium]MBP9724522.1 bifunctional demethylmenaquinone methyltransferase/2-methoxy-6-polyprenyl-